MSQNNVEIGKTFSPVIKNYGSSLFKLLVFSTIGIVFFFIPLFNEQTPLLYTIDTLKVALGNSLYAMAVIVSVVLLLVTIYLSHKTIPFIGQFFEHDGISSKVLYVLGAVFGIMIFFNVGPAFILDADVGGLALAIAGSILLTVLLAGFIVTFIASFGLLQFIGVFFEPLMRPVYKLPGYAAVDACTSIATSAAVDVFLCNKIYLNGLYTKRDVATVASNFTICSLGFFVLLCQWAGIEQYYGLVAITSFAICFIMPIITVRIPPLSRIPNEFVDGTPWTADKNEHAGDKRSLIRRAWDEAIYTADNAESKLVIQGLAESAVFACKVSAYVLSVATIALAIAEYTPVFNWIGMPFIPVLQLFGIPNAAEIAPSVLVGITEIGLPSLLIAGKNVSDAAAFFVVVLSTVQVIFFTESANAIMESDIPLNFWKLIQIFLIRTIIGIPMCALAMHIFF